MTALLLGYQDIERARDFFVSALGFVEERSTTGPDGALTRSHVRFRDTVLMLDRPGVHRLRSPHDVGGVTHMVVINVGDVDAHYARMAEASERSPHARAVVHGPVADRPWGREYELTDAEGYVFAFIE